MYHTNADIEAWALQLNEIDVPLVLDEVEQHRAAAIEDPQRRRYYELTRSAVRRVLAMRLEIPPDSIRLAPSPEGKPHISDRNDCEFSISHSGDWLTIATSGKPVGVDIECRVPRADPLTLARRFFSAADFDLLVQTDAAERTDAFRWQWVSKEAALKAAGCGLANHLHRAACIWDPNGICGVRWDDEYFSIAPFRLVDGTPGAFAWAGSIAASIRWRDPEDLIS